MSGGSTYTPPTFEVPQIDIAKTIAAMFDPQFSAIKGAKSNANKQHDKSSGAIKAAFDALAQEISTQGKKDIQQTYDKAEGDNTKTSRSITNDLQKTISSQSKEDMEMAAALGIGSALDENSSGRGALNEAISDVATSTKDANNRLNEFESIDKQLNKDSVTVANLSGEGHRSELQKQVTDILANLDNRKLDTTVSKANKKAELEAQNQAATNQANQMEAQMFNDWQSGQNEIMMSAADMELERAKMQNSLDIQGLRNQGSAYGADSRVDVAQMNNASRNSSSSNKDKGSQTALQKLLAMKPEGLSTGNIMGIVDNLTSKNTNGNWDTALAKYNQQYPSSQRSKRAAAEYVRLLKGR